MAKRSYVIKPVKLFFNKHALIIAFLEDNEINFNAMIKEFLAFCVDKNITDPEMLRNWLYSAKNGPLGVIPSNTQVIPLEANNLNDTKPDNDFNLDEDVL